MSVQDRSILPPYVGEIAVVTDGDTTPTPAASNEAMGDTGIDNSGTAARHAGMLGDHLAAKARYGA